MRRQILATGPVIFPILLLSLAWFAVACGSSSTTTTAGANTTVGVTTTAAGGTINAAALYAANCAGCHNTVPGASAAQAKAVMESGKGRMPSFTDKLSATEIQAIADYVGNGGK